MRKATLITMMLMLLGFGVLFALADASLKPHAQDAQVARELTQLLAHRGDLEEGTRVKVRRIRASRARLAEDGQGLGLHLVPSAGVRSRSHGLTKLAHRAAEGAMDGYRERSPDWVEVTLLLHGGRSPREAHVLLRVTDEGLRTKGPRLPIAWPLPSPACAGRVGR